MQALKPHPLSPRPADDACQAFCRLRSRRSSDTAPAPCSPTCHHEQRNRLLQVIETALGFLHTVHTARRAHATVPMQWLLLCVPSCVADCNLQGKVKQSAQVTRNSHMWPRCLLKRAAACASWAKSLGPRHPSCVVSHDCCFLLGIRSFARHREAGADVPGVLFGRTHV